MMMMMMIIIIITIIIINDKTCMLMDVAVPSDRNVMQMEAEKKLKIQEFMYRDTMNVEPEM